MAEQILACAFLPQKRQDAKRKRQSLEVQLEHTKRVKHEPQEEEVDWNQRFVSNPPDNHQANVNAQLTHSYIHSAANVYDNISYDQADTYVQGTDLQGDDFDPWGREGYLYRGNE
ncbi:hypothetical protein DL546_009463 [Coniochaeta pulveracea]|uniref:Uncharacterized protein n=1 Tax=Coniochaeta pulveracea TaxID=177199 RepID=A0A420YM66_9PEZI|nr:hypothetical protein DL546_009463 [Coniochaeta pulveracea]